MLIDELIERLNSPDEEARKQVIEGLLDIAFEPGILPLLKKAMGDASWRVRKDAVNAALSFQRNAAAVPCIAPFMIDALHSEDNAGLRNSAVEYLTRLGRNAVSYLIQNSNDKDTDVRKFITDVLGDIGGDAGANKGDDIAEIITDAMITATQDADENVRLSAIEGLGKIGSYKSVQSLLEILEKGDMALKFTTLEALGNIGRPIPMGGVYNALKERLLKKAAYDLIGKVGGTEAVPYLIDGLKENSQSTRDAAILAIKRLDASGRLSRQQLCERLLQIPSAIIEKIAASLESHDANVRKGAVFILGLTGKIEAIKPLIKSLCFDETVDEAKEALIKSGAGGIDVIIDAYPLQEEKVRALLCDILGEIGNKKAENMLILAIKDDYGHVRSSAAAALGKIDPEKAATEVIGLLRDEFDDVRNAAVDTLCLLAKSSYKAILLRVLPLLSAENPYLREKAIIVLGRIGGIEDVEKIRLAIKDDSPLVRKAAVHALGEKGEGRYVQDIILALADENIEVRIVAATALGTIRSKEAIEPLLLTLKDEDIWVKKAAIESLGKIGTENSVKAIKGLVDDENGMVICAAIEAMAMIALQGNQTIEDIKPCLVKCLSHNDTEVVKVAAYTLGRLDKEGSATEILSLLEHTNWDVRAHVADILSDMEDNSIRSCLEMHLKVETDDLVKQKIVEALKDKR